METTKGKIEKALSIDKIQVNKFYKRRHKGGAFNNIVFITDKNIGKRTITTIGLENVYSHFVDTQKKLGYTWCFDDYLFYRLDMEEKHIVRDEISIVTRSIETTITNYNTKIAGLKEQKVMLQNSVK